MTVYRSVITRHRDGVEVMDGMRKISEEGREVMAGV